MMANETGNHTQENDLEKFLTEKKINLTNDLSEDKKHEIAKNFTATQLSEILVKENNDTVKSNILSILEIKDRIREKENEELAQASKELQKINEQKQIDAEKKQADINALKDLLNYDEKSKDNEKKEMNYLIEDIARNNKNRAILDEIKDIQNKIKNDPNNQELKNQLNAKKEELKKLILEKNYVFFKNFSEYNGNLKQLETRRVSGKLRGSEQIGGQKVLTGPQLRFRQNILSRHRINRTIKRLNEIGNDPKKGVNFVLSRTFLSEGGKFTGAFKRLYTHLKIRDTKEFDKIYNEQVNYFLEDLESKMSAKSMSNDDKSVINAVKKRLDYYQQAYKRHFITV